VFFPDKLKGFGCLVALAFFFWRWDSRAARAAARVPGVSGTQWQNSQVCLYVGISGSPAPPSHVLHRTAVNVFSLVGTSSFLCVCVCW
jgi:hypothetical protein